VLSAHDHIYERFAPQDPEGRLDVRRGLRQFVVGTGGASHHRFPGPAAPHSEVRSDDTFGVLKLTLYPASYEWQFIPVAGTTFTDSGTVRCH
jgi:acid phosphatase type 7